jgi:hypothetical protein
MLGNSIEYGSKFSFKPMQDIASFCRTMNMVSQAVLQADENIANTAGVHTVINGVHIPALAIDAGLDISGDAQLGIWVTGTAYTTDGGARVDVRYVEDANGYKQWYKCILLHTSSAATKPGQSDHVNATWRTYWTESSNRALHAYGMVCTNLYTRHVLVLADNTGSMTVVRADNGKQLHAASLVVIPAFDPEIFVAIARIDIVCTDAWVYGDDDKTGQCTPVDLLGPVFPTGTGIDAN